MKTLVPSVLTATLIVSCGLARCSQAAPLSGVMARAMAPAFTAQVETTAPVSVVFPGPKIGVAKVQAKEGWALSNDVLSARFVVANGTLSLNSFNDILNSKTLSFAGNDLFAIHLQNGTSLRSSGLKLLGAPKVEKLRGNPTATRYSDSLNGVQLNARFTDAMSNLSVEWHALLRDGSNYLRQEVSLRTATSPLQVKDIQLLDVALPGARVDGYTDGAPIVSDSLFLALEHPMAKNEIVSAPATAVSSWQPTDLRAGTLRFDAGAVPTDGIYKVRFVYERGAHRLDIARVDLYDGQTLVASDVHAGFTGTAQSNNEYQLPIKNPRADAKYFVVAKIGSDAGIDSYGSVLLSGAATASGRVRGALPRAATLTPGQSWRVSSVVGVYPLGQLRRAFLSYLERERAHPYRQYFHYNSWYDLNIGRNDNPNPMQRMTEPQALEVTEAIGRELVQKRGVKLDGFVWDDGWDDFQTLWEFHKGFPNGFKTVAARAKEQGAGVGAWLSPWGGYGGSKDQRVRYGKTQGFEVANGGFSLAGPKYYGRFRDRTVGMIRDYNMNYFKFDGIGTGTFATGASAEVAPDLDGLTRLIGELRAARADVFINCTVGTWASPFWAMYADSVWRGGSDHGSAGQGDLRNQWMNYRDRTVYERFASKSPLYPLNSLMTHGLLISDRAGPGQMPRDIQGIRNEIRTAIGSGTDLQELYISPRIMTDEMWDSLAQGIKWGRANADVLADTHWVGGDPGKNEVYGYASWAPRKGIIVLRNPSDKDSSISLDCEQVFELPSGTKRNFKLSSPFPDQRIQDGEMKAGTPVRFSLMPFEVLVLEATPQ